MFISLMYIIVLAEGNLRQEIINIDLEDELLFTTTSSYCNIFSIPLLPKMYDTIKWYLLCYIVLFKKILVFIYLTTLHMFSSFLVSWYLLCNVLYKYSNKSMICRFKLKKLIKYYKKVKYSIRSIVKYRYTLSIFIKFWKCTKESAVNLTITNFKRYWKQKCIRLYLFFF